MRIAIISDIHGNAVALDAVLADLEALAGLDGFQLAATYTEEQLAAEIGVKLGIA